MLLSLSWCKVILYVLAIVSQRKLIELGHLPDRSYMFKSVADEWDLKPWIDFKWSQWSSSEGCEYGWEPILATQELNGVKIETENLFRDYHM